MERSELVVAAITKKPPCSGIATCLYKGVDGAISTTTGVIDFWSDPWGNTFKALEASARQLSDSVLPTVTTATLPDLNAQWFVRAYAVTFALAILLAAVLLLPQVVRTARGVLSGRELFDSIGIYFPLFLVGSMFGPPFGMVLVRFFGALSDSIVSWGLTSTAGTVTARFRSMLSAQDATGIAGGAPVADLLVVLVLLGLLLVIVMLVVQLVTLYFTGVLLPLGLVWLIDPARRRFGTRIVSLWVGLLAAHPLLFLLLSVAYLMVGGNVDAFGEHATLQRTVTLIVALLALFVAGFSPLALMRLAPVMLSGGGTAGGGLALPPIGLRSLSEASDRFAPPASSEGTVGGSDGGAAPSPAPSVSERAVSASNPDDGGDAVPASPPRDASAAPPPEASGASTAEPAAVPILNGVPVSSADTAAGATTGAAAAGAATEGAEAATVAAGAGESATGVGAVVGVPTILAGLGLAGVRSVKRVGDQVIEKAAAPVEDGERVGSERLRG